MRPTLLTIARRALSGEVKLARGTVMLAAVSGGPDSMALLHVLARLCPDRGLALVAHGVDHGLRPEAAAELDGAERLAKELGVPFARSRVALPRGGNLQARARAARYDALAAAASRAGAAAIATAHHADDRAETFLLRLLRGAGARGLAVLPPRAPLAGTTLELVRPLLRARRDDVRAHLRRHGIEAAEDPSNADPRFLRTRVRRELLPLLEELGPGVVGHLEAVADELGHRRDEAEPGLPLPRATQRALAELLEGRRPGATVWLPGGLVVSRNGRARSPSREPRARR